MATQDQMPSSYINVPNSDLYYDPATGTFMSHGTAPAPQPNQWAWGDQGMQIAGSSDPLGILNSFLDIKDDYRQGSPITADTWQDAVRKSLTGFNRANYGVDPIFNWSPQSGKPGSQFRMGTMEELANQLPGFFDTSGNLVRNNVTGQVVLDHGRAAAFDPLLSLNPQDKLLAFEDVPFEQIEKSVGGLPGQFLNPAYAPAYQAWVAPLDKQYAEINRQQGIKNTKQIIQQKAALEAQMRAGPPNAPPQFLSLAQLQQSGNVDFNDLLYKLNIDQYAPPAPIIRATPESVLAQFFDTAPYRLAFGNDPGVIDPYASPADRFRADPGYQFAQTEGQRQLQFDQSKRGLLESGRGQRDMLGFSQGLADQNYQRKLAQDQELFNQWKSGIAGVMGQGANAAGQISGNDMTLAQLLGNSAMNTGNILSNLSGQTGTNIANIFGNQGIFGGSAFLNTGAAQASNIMSAASIQAQIAAGNAQAQAAAQSAQAGASNASGGGAGQLLGQTANLAGSFF